MNLPDCFHPTRTVVIIDMLLRTLAAMHTTIGLALEMNSADFTNWPPGNIGHYDSLGCQRTTQNRFLYSLIIISIFLACYHVAKINSLCFCGGRLFVGAPLPRPNMLNMPKSASVQTGTWLTRQTLGSERRRRKGVCVRWGPSH